MMLQYLHITVNKVGSRAYRKGQIWQRIIQVKDYLSELVETIRDQKNIIGKEFYGGEYV